MNRAGLVTGTPRRIEGLPRVVGELALLWVPEARRWRLDRPLWVEDRGRRWAVPAGFLTDLASVPRVPLAYLLFGGGAPRPPVVHDWLYATADRSRAEADELFRDLLLSEGETRPRAEAMFRAVRVFGGGAWRNHRRRRP